MKTLDLFTGIGGFTLGLERAGFETVAFCEIDEFCRKVLKKHWQKTPIFTDIRNINATELKKYEIKTIDVVCGGFPCQPYSVAGKKRGKQDNRDLWPEMLRVIKTTKPSWVIGENVANFSNMELERTQLDLESEGFEVQPLIIPACAVNAPHQRNRTWIIAHSQSNSNNGIKIDREAIQEKQREFRGGNSQNSYWQISKPPICGMDDGLPSRVDRLRSLGNAIVPDIAEIIGRAIMEVEIEK